MKKIGQFIKKNFSKLFKLAIVLAFLFAIYQICVGITDDKIAVKAISSNECYSGSELNAIVTITKEGKSGNYDLVDGKVVAKLLDGNDKTVRKTRVSQSIKKGEVGNVSIKVPENLESGKYTLEIKGKSGIFSKKAYIDLSIKEGGKQNIVINLDKGIYKPGDTINFSGMVLNKDSNEPIANEEIKVNIYDGNENRVYASKSPSSEYGIVTGSFKLGDEVNSGNYKLELISGGVTETKSFKVNPYITPKFEIKIESDKDNYLVGDVGHFTAKVNYFFGEPAADAIVTVYDGPDKIEEARANENGEFEFAYSFDEIGPVNFRIGAVDTSNYFVETSKTFYAGKDIINVEILPEYGDILTGIDQEIYIFTKKIDGTPVKTRNNVSINSLKKQVVTDENGFGIITLGATDTTSFGAETVQISVDSMDSEDHRVSMGESFEVTRNYANIVKTDKLIYNEKDDINVELKSSTGIEKSKVALVKNGRILKMFSTDSDEVNISLDEGLTGIIDIYSFNQNVKRNYSYWDGYDSFDGYSSNQSYRTNKRTIFVKPSKALGIDISIPQEEYKPGDKLSISFAAKDEKNQNVDANLLVSILDEAVLSLADNDLSIDNIKLALADIELTDEVTAADLYASIAEGKDESKFLACLLRQTGSGFTPTESHYDRNSLDSYERVEMGKAILIIIFILLVIMKIASLKNKSWIFDAIAVIYLTNVFYIILEEITYDGGFILGLIIALVVYIFALSHYKKIVYEYIIEMLLLPLPYIIVMVPFLQDERFIIPLLIPFLIWICTYGIYKDKADGIQGLKGFVYRYSKVVLKALIIFILTYFIMNELTSPSDSLPLIIPVVLFLLMKMIYAKKDNKPVSSIFKEVKEEKKEENKKVKANGNIVINVDGGFVTFLLIIILLFAGLGILQTTRNFSSNISSMSSTGRFDDWDIADSSMSVNQFDSMGDTSGASSSISNPLSSMFGVRTFAKNIAPASADQGMTSLIPESSVEEAEVSNENSPVSTETEAKVRNVFLESLAFLPEVMIKNGNGNVEIPISDNITTWDIQVVGNTKDGRIGSSSKTFKVFQDFFVDFSMPANSVVGDYINIPISIFNYENSDNTIKLNVVNNNWSDIGDYPREFTVSANSQVLVYVPVTINKFGDCMLRVEAESSSGMKDIVERTMTVKPNGLLVEKTLSSGAFEKKYSTDYFTQETLVEGTRKITVKIAPSLKTEAVEGLEDMLSMPSGCLEQTSSSLYPDILILKYLRDSNKSNEEVEKRALEYISKGYQRLLTFEVTGTPGGFSLYGHSPAEPVLTAFALMELNDLSEVYDVDENVIKRMQDYLFDEQNAIGSFKIGSTYIGSASNTDDLSMNAYIIWALSEVDPKAPKLEKSVSYLESKLSTDLDSYTVALMANVFANTNSSKYNEAVQILKDRAQVDAATGNSYISSAIRDYYGTYGTRQNVQATALTAMAFAKGDKESKLVESFVKYIISSKSGYGTYGSTQTTILALKAIDLGMGKDELKNTTVTLNVNGEERKVNIGDDVLASYVEVFENAKDEGKVEINTGKGKAYYEIIEEYYVPYTEEVNKDSNIDVHYTMNKETYVTGIITQNIELANHSGEPIQNGLVKIYIPQGCSVVEESLSKLEHEGLIEKYEYNYNTINLYIRNVSKSGLVSNLEVQYRALYPEKITGGAVDVYDYYNPEIRGIARPSEITVTQ